MTILALTGRRVSRPPWRLTRTALSLAAALAVTFAAAALGSAATAAGLDGWYPSLAKPAWTPPNWLFGPVWTALYSLMAVSAWLVWRDGGRAARVALVLFAAQLALNVAWSVVFFGLRSPGWGVAVIAALTGAIVATTAAFDRVNRRAASLLLPYLAWVGFAAALNVAIWQLN